MTHHHPTPPKRQKRAKYAAAVALAMVLSSSPWLVKRGCHFTAGSFKADFEPVHARTNSLNGKSNAPLELHEPATRSKNQ